jgi:hypothetical protein
MKGEMKMGNLVERISALHRSLVADPNYQKYISAKTDGEAVEGGLTFDTYRAAKMLQQAAVAAGDVGIAGLQLEFIGDAVNELIERRYDLEKLRAEELEWQEAVRMFLGLDDEDIARQERINKQKRVDQ